MAKLQRRTTAMIEAATAERREQDFGLSTPQKRRVVEVPLDRIEPNPEQPRHLFDPDGMEALKASIERNGLLQPVGIKPLDNGRFQLVYGERRFRAVRDLGHDTILGLTIDGDDDEIAVIENLQRVDLDPFEEADAFERLRQRHGYPYSVIAQITGRSKSEVGRVFSLLKLPNVIKDEYRAMADRPGRTHMFDIAAAAPEEHLDLWKAVKAGSAVLPDGEADASSEGASDDAAEPGVENGPQHRRTTSNAILSALPKRVAMKIVQANEVLTVLRSEPKPLWRSDLQMLVDMRDALNEIIESTKPTR
jgi:ParB family transcriptional regulator, chromosome partitioning protein